MHRSLKGIWGSNESERNDSKRKVPKRQETFVFSLHVPDIPTCQNPENNLVQFIEIQLSGISNLKCLVRVIPIRVVPHAPSGYRAKRSRNHMFSITMRSLPQPTVFLLRYDPPCHRAVGGSDLTKTWRTQLTYFKKDKQLGD